MLEIKQLQKHIGGLSLADNIDLTIQKGARHALIGANGAGKTSLFRLIGGQMKSDSGTIIYDGKDITAVPQHKRVSLGIACSFQRNNLFPHQRVIDNLRIAAIASMGLQWNFLTRKMTEVEELVLKIADMFGLTDNLKIFLSELSYGVLRQLEIAMAYTNAPKLLLLDEPMAGMSLSERQKIAQLLHRMPKDLSLLMIEHDMDTVFSMADTITVMHAGAIVMTDSPDEVRRSSKVQTLYLGA